MGVLWVESTSWQRRRRAALVVIVAAFVQGLAGCAHGPLTTRLRTDVVRPQPGVVLFLCDGLPPDLVERGCREGWLPNIRERFWESGTRVNDALTVVPAVTYAAITSMLTGVTPGTHGIPGNRWFDPGERLFRNYATIPHYRDVNFDFDVPTIYERIDPLFSTSIQAAHMRGVSRNIANWAQSGVRWFFGVYTGVDALTATTVDKVAREANQRRAWPALLTCYFPGLDSMGHLYGVSSAEYRRAAEKLDGHLGRVCDWMESQGLLATTYLVLISDHGMVDVHEHIDLLRLVRDEWGRAATDKMLQDGSFGSRRRYFDRFDTVVAYQDGRKAILYFAGPSGWDERPDPAVVSQALTEPPAEQRLWNLEGVDLVAYLAGDSEATIRSPRGKARIEERTTAAGPEYRYVPVPDDVLGYQDDSELAAFVAAGFHESRAWLRATASQEYPDVVPQLLPLLRQRRFGQVLIFASPGYSFTEEWGGHGGIHRDEMRATMIFAGPGIEAGGRIECARVVDLVPTLMTLLGVDVPEDGSLEGIPLFADVPAAVGGQVMQP